MAFEALKIRLLMMLDEATHQPEDLHELQEELREEIAGLKAQGLPVPEDIAHLEARLETALKRSRT
jgi:predicted  nucleic acid-binding Zn-ribbon protein